MKSVASRELRNRTRALLEKVEAGQSIAITVDGRAVATIEPIGRTQRWMPREEFVWLGRSSGIGGLDVVGDSLVDSLFACGTIISVHLSSFSATARVRA